MSSLYGSDALGGVINVITKKTPDEWGGNLISCGPMTSALSFVFG